MSQTRAAQRYALAVLNLAVELKQLDTVSQDFQNVQSLFASSRDFLIFLKSPVINQEKKKVVIREIFAGKIGDLAMKFFLLVTAKGRETILPEILSEFAKLRDKHRGIINVAVHSAMQFTKEQEHQLSEQLKSVTGKSVCMTHAIDPALIGGFTVRFDDTVWDGSVRRQLEVLRERFAGATG